MNSCNPADMFFTIAPQWYAFRRPGSNPGSELPISNKIFGGVLDMNIGGQDYKTLAIIDDQNNMLCVISDNQAICVEKLKIVAEQGDSKFAFVPMENSATKCFIRTEGAVLPANALTTEQLFASKNVPNAPEENSPTEIPPEIASLSKEELEKKVKEENAQNELIERVGENLKKSVPGERNFTGNIGDLIKSLPPETLATIAQSFLSSQLGNTSAGAPSVSAPPTEPPTQDAEVVPEKQDKSEVAQSLTAFEEELAKRYDEGQR